MLTGGELEGELIRPTVIADAAPRPQGVLRRGLRPGVHASTPTTSSTRRSRSRTARPFGLQAGIFTSRLDTALRAAEELEFGGVTVNEAPTFRADQMPYGGVKDSGNTREGPAYAIRELTEERLVVIERGQLATLAAPMARLLGRLLGAHEGDGAVAPEARPHPGALRRERRALVRAREERIRDLGGLMLEMYRRDRFREDLLQERCLEVIALEDRLGRGRRPARPRPPSCAGRGPLHAASAARRSSGARTSAPTAAGPTGATPVVSCSGCGAPVPADARFCAGCGHPVEADRAAARRA